MYTPFPTQQTEIEKIVKFIDSKTAKKGIFAISLCCDGNGVYIFQFL